MTPVRLAAARILLNVARGRATLASELERERPQVEDRRDRALLGEIATGTLRWRNEIDAVIAAGSRRSIEQIEARALTVLRIGVYQMRHLERVPAHAIVNESVEVIRAMEAPRAAGFVNAVLRGLVRNPQLSALPARPAAPFGDEEAAVRYLSITLSHPSWLVRRWLGRYGFEATEAWCRFNNSSPDVTIRSLGRLTPGEILGRLQVEGLAAGPAPYVADAIRLPPGVLGQVSAELREQVFVQDEGAQLIARMAAARPGERVLDVCAAPGGKTLVLARDMAVDGHHDTTRLIAGDRRRPRLALLAELMRRAHVPAAIVALDALRPLPFAPVFDCVLLDAPCSGLGTLRRDPDLKWSRQEADLSRLVADEQQMMATAAALVRPGGRFVYATCSSEPDENRAVVRGFLTAHPVFSLAPVAARAVPANVVDDEGCLVTTPFDHGLDAFFAAVLVRQPTT